MAESTTRQIGETSDPKKPLVSYTTTPTGETPQRADGISGLCMAPSTFTGMDLMLIVMSDILMNRRRKCIRSIAGQSSPDRRVQCHATNFQSGDWHRYLCYARYHPSAFWKCRSLTVYVGDRHFYRHGRHSSLPRMGYCDPQVSDR